MPFIYDAVFCDVPIHIKVVADKEVDPAFGTGAVGLTPAHSNTDWEIADRHQLSHEVIVINEFHPVELRMRVDQVRPAINSDNRDDASVIGEGVDFLREWVQIVVLGDQ